MYEALDRLMKESQEENIDFIVALKKERIREEMIEFVLKSIVKQYHCTLDEAYSFWEDFRTKEGK
ncbi:MAG: hypothetical protein J6A75_02310 [Lachnospiraceae bacterium]|nr:hypothetical protein [Lachnospiraceae bacterium]